LFVKSVECERGEIFSCRGQIALERVDSQTTPTGLLIVHRLAVIQCTKTRGLKEGADLFGAKRILLHFIQVEIQVVQE
jgi:hypothetical protein